MCYIGAAAHAENEAESALVGTRQVWSGSNHYPLRKLTQSMSVAVADQGYTRHSHMWSTTVIDQAIDLVILVARTDAP